MVSPATEPADAVQDATISSSLSPSAPFLSKEDDPKRETKTESIPKKRTFERFFDDNDGEDKDGSVMMSIWSSEPFVFLIGPQKNKFTVQRALFKHISQPLHSLMNGQMKEAKSGIAHLENVDPSIFSSFIDFAYTFVKTSDGTLLSEDVKEEDPIFRREPLSCELCTRWEPEGLKYSSSKLVYVTCGNKFHRKDVWTCLWQIFQREAEPDNDTPVLRAVVKLWNDFEQRQIESFECRYKRSLTSTVNLYNFADKYLVKGLKKFTLIRLHHDLIDHELYHFATNGPGSVEDLCEALRLVFEHDEPRDFWKSKQNKLQRLLSSYALLRNVELFTNSDFNDLIVDMPHISLAMQKVQHELLDSLNPDCVADM